VLLVTTGCQSESWTSRKLIPVQGTVSIDGQPIPEQADAEVLFIPVDSDARAPLPRSKVAVGGVYSLQTGGWRGATAGQYRVVVLVGDTKSLAGRFDPVYASQQKSPLLIDVLENKPAGGYDLQLTPARPR
jgi:hypothetical protein